MSRIILALVLCLVLPSGGMAQKRVALVIGNSAYQSAPPLANPRNDATDMAAALAKLGFQVLDGFDLDKASFDKKVRDFADALSGAKAGIFFYAGHGLQVAGANYLVPVDAKLSSASALDWEMVRLDLVQRTMERETETNILFLDACRDNPLARNLARTMGTRSGDIGRGLAATEAGAGTLISFSTQPGNVALDGAGRNSPFAGALVKRISTSNDELSSLLIDVRKDVRNETQNKQVPWEHSAMTGRFYFNAWAATASPPPAPKASEASREWERVDKASVAELETFVRRHRSSAEAEYARARIQNLTQQAAVATPTNRTPDASIERGLVGHWTLDSTDVKWTSATIGVAYDASGKNNTGTLVGMNRATSAIVGKVGEALKFNGSSNYIMNLSPNLPKIDAAMTISAWLSVGAISDARSAVVLNDFLRRPRGQRPPTRHSKFDIPRECGRWRHRD